jgi:hypothetical protein
MQDVQLNEPILDDDYPVYFGYLYVLDGVPIQSDIEGTVAQLKRYYTVEEVRRCDIAGRRAQ